jgi:hypothetical protein
LKNHLKRERIKELPRPVQQPDLAISLLGPALLLLEPPHFRKTSHYLQY